MSPGCQTNPASNDVVTLETDNRREGIAHAYLIRAGQSRSRSAVRSSTRAQDAMPPALRELAGLGVARGEEFCRCPFALRPLSAAAGKPMDAAAFRCVWPERLALTVEARGGTFTQRWQVFAESWVALARRRRVLAARRARSTARQRPWSSINDIPILRLAPGNLHDLRPLRTGVRAPSRCRCRSPRRSSISRGRPARRAARASGRCLCGWASAAAPSRRRPWKCRSIVWCEDEIPAYPPYAFAPQRGG